MLALGVALVKAGHQVSLCVAENYRSSVEALGLDYVRGGDDAQHLMTTREVKGRGPLGSTKWGRLIEVGRIMVREQFAALEEAARGADLIVGTMLTTAAPSIAEHLGIPCFRACYARRTLDPDRHRRCERPLARGGGEPVVLWPGCLGGTGDSLSVRGAGKRGAGERRPGAGGDRVPVLRPAPPRRPSDDPWRPASRLTPTFNINRESHMTERNGHCLCGAVRFRLSAEPLATRVCWCRDCQHISANGTVNLLVPTAALDISGQMSVFARTADSGNEVRQRFCPSCGSHLFANSSARPQFTVVRAGTLDDPSSVRPTMNIWSSSAPTWACLDPALERVEQQPAPPQSAKPAA